MSCGACQSKGTQPQSRGRCVSDTEESNFGNSAYASDAPSGDECACDKDPADCCGEKKGTCGSGQRGKGQKPEERRNQQGCGTSNAQNGGGKRPCPCEQGPQGPEAPRTAQTNKLCGMGRIPSNSSTRRLPPQNAQQNMFGRTYSDGRDTQATTGCNRFNNSQMNQMDLHRMAQPPQSIMTGGQGLMRAGSGRNAMIPDENYGSQCDTNAPPKQMIAPCCFANNSLLSLTDRNSQPAISRDNSQRISSPKNYGGKQSSTCGSIPPEVKPSENNAQSFVCPSCAELDNMVGGTYGSNTNCENIAEPPPLTSQYQQEDNCVPESVPMGSEEKPKKKNAGHGFWQQLQFEIYQQQDGEDEDSNLAQQGASADPCVSESGRNDDFQEVYKPKKSGNKVWQQLTLDIFQSKDDDGSDVEADNSSRQGWQQQLKLQLFQEKYSGEGDEDQATDVCGAVDEYGETDQFNC